MAGLPESAGAIGAALLVIGALLGAALGWIAWRRSAALAEEAGAAGRVVAALVAVALATTVAAAPFVAWRVVEDIRYTSSLTRAEAETLGVRGRDVDAAVYDHARRHIPPGATYYLATSKEIDPTVAGAFRQWALSALLPRVRVDEAADAEWVLSWGVPPGGLGVKVRRPVELGRSRYESAGRAPYWLMRVIPGTGQ